MFDLIITGLKYASDFFGDDNVSDPKYSDFPEGGKPAKSKADNFLTMASAAKAYLDVGEKSRKSAFQTAEFRQPRSVSQLTSPKPFQPLGNMRFITGAENADIQNAMRVLSNAQNKQVAQLIPYSAINYKGGPPPNISIGSTNIQRRNRDIV